MAELRLGTIAINIDSDASRFERSSQRARQSLTRTGRAVRNFQRTLRRSNQATDRFIRRLRTLATVAVVGTIFGRSGISSFAKDVAAAGAELVELAIQTNVSVEQLQLLQRVFQADGVAAEQFQKVFNKLALAVGYANQDLVTYTRLFDQLGVNIHNANNELRPLTEIFLDSADALSKMENVTDRQTIAAELFGARLARLQVILAKGRKGIIEATESQRQFGLVTNEQAATLKVLSQRFTDFGQVIDVNVRQFVAALAPSITGFLRSVQSTIPAVFQNIGAVLEFLHNNIRLVYLAAALLFTRALGPAVIGRVIAGIKLIATAFVALRVVVASILKTFLKLAVVVVVADAIVTAFQEWGNHTKKIFEGVYAFIKLTFLNVKEFFENLVGGLVFEWNLFYLQIQRVFQGIKVLSSGVFQAIRAALSGEFDNAIERMKTMRGEFSNTIKSFNNQIKSLEQDRLTQQLTIQIAADDEKERLKRTVREGLAEIQPLIQKVGENLTKTLTFDFSASKIPGLTEKDQQEIDDLKNQIVEINTSLDFDPVKIEVDDSALKDLNTTLTQTQDFTNRSERAFNSFFNEILDGTSSAVDSFKNLANAIGQAVLRILVLEPLAASFAGALGGFFGGIFGGASTSVNSGAPGFRAEGGPVSAGRAYIVGERRPELFIPNQSGRIHPEVNLAGGAGQIVINYNIESTDGPGVRRALDEASPRIIQQAVAASTTMLSRKSSARSAVLGR